MSMLIRQIDKLRDKAQLFEGYQNGEISNLLREAADIIEGLRERLQDDVLSGEYACMKDSRKKLEADIWAGCDHLTMMERGHVLVNVPYDKLLGWLDRQAAITSLEWCYSNEQLEIENAELQAKLDKLRIM